MTPRSCVGLWTLLLLLCALLRDTQALCDSSCSSEVKLTSTTTNITVTAVNCSISTDGKNSTDGVITALTPGTIYDVQVHCFILSCCETVTTKPGAVKILSGTVTTSSIFVTWTAPDGGKSFYRVIWTHENQPRNVQTTETSANITGLTAGTRYDITVTAVAEDHQTEGEASTLTKYTKPEVVRYLNVTEKTTTSTYLNWTKPNGNYSFYRVNWTDGSIYFNTTVNETNINVSDLTPGVKYTFTVQSVAGDNKTESEKSEISSYTQPEIVTNLNASEITTTSIYLNWTKPNGNYSFYRVQCTDDSIYFNPTTSETNINVTDLTPGMKYTFTVQSVAGDNKTESEMSEISSYTQPEVVRDLIVMEQTTTSIYLNWTKPHGNYSFYRVRWTDGSIYFNTTVSETGIKVTDLIPGVQYRFTVQSVAGDNKTESKKREISSYTKPEAIRNLIVMKQTTTSIYLNWTKPNGNYSFYRVRWTDGSIYFNTTVNETNINVSDLTPGVKYTFTVQSVAGDNKTESEKSEISAYTQPEIVMNLNASEITTTSIYLNWTKPNGNYSFYRVKWTDGSIYFNTAVNETNIKVTDLTPGVKYTFTVQSVAGDNKTESEMSEISSYTQPEVVRDLIVMEQTTTSIYLNWTKPHGNYSFYRVRWTDGSIYFNTTVSETGINVTDLIPGVKYTFTVQSVAGDNKTESEMSEISSFTQPEVVRDLIVMEQTTTSIYLNWTKPHGNYSFYRVRWTDGSIYFNTTVSETGIKVTDLIPGVQYRFTVQSVAGDNKTESKKREISSYTKPEAIRNLIVMKQTTTSIYLNWTKPNGNYSFYRVRWTDGSIYFNTTVNETNINVSDLTPGVKYTFTVQSVAGDNKTESEKSEISSFTQPEVVRDLIVMEQTTTSIYLNWTKPHGNYSFYRVRWTDGSIYFNTTVSETGIKLTDLIPGVQYRFTVQSVAGDNKTESKKREISSYTKPEAIRNLIVMKQTTTSIYLNWTKPNGNYSFYRVRWTDGSIYFNTTVNETNINVSDLTPGVKYTFTVQSVAGDNKTESEKSEISSFTQPEVVRDLIVMEQTTTSIYLNWTKPHGNYSFYRVRWTDGSIYFNTTVSETGIKLTDLIPGVQYRFTVQSVAGDNKTESKKREISSYTKPEIVMNLNASEITTTSIYLNWTKPNGNYSFYRVKWTDGSIYFNTAVNETNINVTDLTPGVKYTFTVQSVAGDNKTESEMSEISSYTQPEVVRDLIVMEQTTTSIYLNWTKPHGNYSFYRVRWTDGSIYFNTTVSETGINVTDLIPGVKYTFTVQSVAGDNKTESEMSEISSFTQPEVVRDLIVMEQTTTSIYLNWTKPNGNYSFYRVRWTDGSIYFNTTVNETGTNVTDLTPGVKYTFTVQSVAGDNKTESKKREISSYTKPEIVMNLKASEITTTSIYLNWTKPNGNYSFYRVKWTDGSIYFNTTVNETGTNVTDLTPGVKYTFTVQSVAGDNKTESEMSEISSYTRPEVVRDLSVTEQTTTSVYLNWTKPNGNSPFYRVMWKNDSSSWSDNVTETSKNVTDLTPGVKYTFTVQSVAGDNETESEKSEISSYTRPNKPVNITVTRRGTDHLDITWSFSGGKDNFDVNISNSALELMNVSRTIVSSASFTGLRPGRIFKVTVTAVAGAFQTASDVFPFATFPTPPQEINITARTNSSINLTWGAPDRMEGAPDVRYNIAYPRDDGGGYESEDTINTNAELSSLSSGTSYCINVTTVGPQNLTSTAEEKCSFTLPNPVLNLVARPDSNTAVTVQWSHPDGVQPHYSYSVQVFNATGALVNSQTVKITSAHVPDLEPASKYIIKVTTVAASESKAAAVEASCYTMPNAVTELIVSHANATSIRLQWLRQNDHQPSFIYQVEAFLGSQVVHNKSTHNETHTIYSLIPGTQYKFRVFAVFQNVRSAPASIEHYTEPEKVSDVTVVGSTVDLSVSWELVSGQVSSYFVQLYSGDEKIQNTTDLSNETKNVQFSGLKPGVEYCVVVSTKSGPQVIHGQKVCNATFPNPPGRITVQSQTFTSINFTWTSPENMTRDQYNFSVTTVNGSFPTVNNWYLLDKLESGSPYSISVVTVGVRGYQSTSVTAQNYTRPFSVTNLKPTEITTDTVTLVWTQPGSKSDYSYSVKFGNDSRILNSTTIKISGLTSGSNFSLTVTTRTADGTEADPETVSYFTRPHPVQNLRPETLNTTAIRLTWVEPLEYKDNYRYSVKVTGCGNQTKNLKNNSVEISGLNPGTNCTFCVSVKVEDTEGAKDCASQYTKPETVQPTVSTQSNDSIQVSWTKPAGNVEKYQVILSRSSSDLTGSTQPQSVELDCNSTACLFGNLSAGRLYSVEVSTYSGPFNATSGSKQNATFPNPPGPIEILYKTNSTIHFRWAEAPLMGGAQFFYRLTLTPSADGNVANKTTNTTNSTFGSLPSGTLFTVSVSTVGILGFESQEVNELVSTRPLSVPYVMPTAHETHIQVIWAKPDEYKADYRYNVTWKGSDEASGKSVVVNDTDYTVAELIPGSRYNISVTTETSDGTQAEPSYNSTCTRASPVQEILCEPLNAVNALIPLTWPNPSGQYSGFMISVNGTQMKENSACCSQNVSNLRHCTDYNISVVTLSCGEASTPKEKTCKTGITNPPIPSDYVSKVTTDAQDHNKFSIKIDPSLFNATNGPITHVGVLVTTKTIANCSDCATYLGKTYEDFKKGNAPAYLATVTALQSSRSAQDLSIEVGNNAVWEGYPNSALEANTRYWYGIVLFTSLSVEQSLVVSGASLFSQTDIIFTAKLDVDPVVIGMAVGVTLGIFCILFIVLIGFIIFWKRLSKKESPEIQIHSLRAKVSVPVRVEDYEAYFRKQRADSNCGFAEEFEDLKTVGTAQAKIHALSLENKPKNRYTNVLPYDSSRVKLSIIHGSPNDDYINANYMPGYNSRKEFIAAQGPLPATVNEFWRMIWEKNVQTLVMLTRCNEQGRVKCEQYWSPGTKHFGNITVTTTSDIPLEDWTIKDFTIKNLKTAETRSVRHFHFTAWPDHGVPETTELLISFRHLVREHMNQYSRHSPTVVHCSAGVGRTGTFIAIDHLIFQIERENIVDVYGIVHELRMHRALMVQTEEQYVFLNQCALDIIRSRTGTNVDLIYQNTAALSIYENLEPHRGLLKNKDQDT
ncbi:receptor-type tyrosine-protein phosphatase beta isoform X5 [Salarias fasciatus]|uniref:receptor-type tyrosine-protein phosphatase beta isoform X5 n=1 Tax=Salarias fasciatus TaxID=181472 RepID=UPI001176D0DE|nr:receptor-type tyrosine-protein phosphatase beta-like isoform X5 [Salarias fasciatus]